MLFWTSLKDVVRLRVGVRESEKQSWWPLADTIKKEKNKTGTSACGSFVVAYFQPATSLNLLHVDVTECICTLCLCCCTLYVTLSMFFHVWTSFNLLCMFYVLLFWMSLKDEVRESARESERQYQRSLSDNYHQKRKGRYKTGTSGCGSFVVISNLLLPSTVYILPARGHKCPLNTHWSHKPYCT